MTVVRPALAGLFVLLLGILAGCQTAPRKTSGGALQENNLYALTRWQAEGKIALQMGDERESASFQWAQQGTDYAVHLFGPFGQGTTWLRKKARSVTLENAKTGTHRATTAENLMQEVLGWQVPVTNLQFWLRGIPAKRPKSHHIERDPAGFITGLQQQGWQVIYSKHQDFNGWWLPTKILAERNELRLTIILKNWQLPPAPVASL